MINRIISFKQLPVRICDNKKLPKKYTVCIENNTDVFVRNYNNPHGNNFVASVDTKKLSNMAKNRFGINLDKKTLENGLMSVTNEKNKGKGLGVVMHLNNVINLLENDLERIELKALPIAVLFHGKMKFEPNLYDYESILETMLAISQKDCTKFPDLKQVVEDAGNYFDEAFESRGLKHTKEKIKEANSIVIRYIEIMSTKKLEPQDKVDYAFKNVLDMYLTKEKILENKDFFNALFKKFNIDYKI